VTVNRKGRLNKKKEFDEVEFQHTFSKEFGQLPPEGSAPEGFHEAMLWAEAQKKLMKIN
jgi:hypothetical protein